MAEQPRDELRLSIEEAAEVWAEEDENREVGNLFKHSEPLAGGTTVVIALTARYYEAPIDG